MEYDEELYKKLSTDEKGNKISVSDTDLEIANAIIKAGLVEDMELKDVMELIEKNKTIIC